MKNSVLVCISPDADLSFLETYFDAGIRIYTDQAVVDVLRDDYGIVARVWKYQVITGIQGIVGIVIPVNFGIILSFDSCRTLDQLETLSTLERYATEHKRSFLLHADGVWSQTAHP